jgi:hypothetical protein
MLESIFRIVAAGLEALAHHAPAVARALTGGRDPSEAIAEARAILEAAPTADDAWAEDLAERKSRGDEPTQQ